MECFQHYFALGVSVMRMESGAASTLYTPGSKPPKSLSIQKKRPVNCFLMELHQGLNHTAKSCVAYRKCEVVLHTDGNGVIQMSGKDSYGTLPSGLRLAFSGVCPEGPIVRADR